MLESRSRSPVRGQGRRSQTNGRPWPVEIGGSGVDVGGVRAGCCAQADYGEIVRCAAKNFVAVVAEIEGPAHSDAAPSSRAEPKGVGLSPDENLCLGREVTYFFLDGVVRQMAAMTPGSRLSVGGDEPGSIPTAHRATYIRRVRAAIAKYGKKLTVVAAATTRGAKMVTAPAFTAYLGMKYHENAPWDPVGDDRAGYLGGRDMHDWAPVTSQPATSQPGAPADAVAGVGARCSPSWSTTRPPSRKWPSPGCRRWPGRGGLRRPNMTGTRSGFGWQHGDRGRPRPPGAFTRSPQIPLPQDVAR